MFGEIILDGNPKFIVIDYLTGNTLETVKFSLKQHKWGCAQERGPGLILTQFIGFWNFSQRQSAKTLTRLRMRAVSSEPSLLAFTKYGSRGRLSHKTRHSIYSLCFEKAVCLLCFSFCTCTIFVFKLISTAQHAKLIFNFR